MHLNEYLKELRDRVEQGIGSAFLDFTGKFEESNLERALQYSLAAGGKRIRPVIVAGTAEAFGAHQSQWTGYAAALEAIHCGSLIHDDLPMLDNDDTRRGRPSCHIKFGEAVALLAGDAILPLANILILQYSQDVSDSTKLDLLKLISDSTYEVCRGQVRDVELMKEAKQSDSETLIRLHQEKTAALFKAAFMGGGLIADASSEQRDRLARCGGSFGLFFQLADDLDDYQEGADQEGEEMVNLVSLLGRDEARLRLKALKSEIEELSAAMPIKPLVEALFALIPVSNS